MRYEKHPGTLSPTNGVYIQDTDGYYHSDSLDSRLTANGIAVISDEHSLVVALEDACDPAPWGAYGKAISGLTSISSSSGYIDYDGESNTDKIIEQTQGYTDTQGIYGAPAAEACRNYIFPNGRNGYLGAYSEFELVWNNRSSINSLLLEVGGISMSSFGICYWTSSVYPNANTWAWRTRNSANQPDVSTRYKEYQVRAFCSI